jgi:hypothetical protein
VKNDSDEAGKKDKKIGRIKKSLAFWKAKLEVDKKEPQYSKPKLESKSNLKPKSKPKPIKTKANVKDQAMTEKNKHVIIKKKPEVKIKPKEVKKKEIKIKPKEVKKKEIKIKPKEVKKKEIKIKPKEVKKKEIKIKSKEAKKKDAKIKAIKKREAKEAKKKQAKIKARKKREAKEAKKKQAKIKARKKREAKEEAKKKEEEAKKKEEEAKKKEEEAKRTYEEELEEQLSEEEITGFRLEKTDMDKMCNRVCEIIAGYETDGTLQSELWKKLKLSSRDGSRLALKLERMGMITREKILEKERWTYKLIIKKIPINTKSIEGSPCLTCPVEAKCSLDGEISPKTCKLIEDWVLIELKNK